MKRAKTLVVPIKIQREELDIMLAKVDRLCALLREANSLVRELASTEINISLNVEM